MRMPTFRSFSYRTVALAALMSATWGATLSAQNAPAPTHGERAQRLVIRNVMVIEGNGTPAEGPKDVVIEGNRIVQIANLDPVALRDGNARRPAKGDAEIDGTGHYVMPGLINLHGHVQEERGGTPQPLDYQLKLWLGMGITSVRDVGSNTSRTLELKQRSARGDVHAPRLFVYARYAYMPIPLDEAAVRQRVRDLKAMGADGTKLFGMDRELYAPLLDEANKVGLRTAHHMAVDEANANDAAAGRLTSIEHWYGVPDAAIPSGVQDFPANFNYNDEGMRFRLAGRLWREAEPERLQQVLKSLADSGVAWNPTLDIYEASRDLQRAESQPWFRQYLHPTLEKFFQPDPASHGSYFSDWSSVDETYWKQNYQIWFKALRDFESYGGVIGAGEDAGFIYQVYGFGLIRELELHQEAGFPALKVLQHATLNNARILGEESRIGRLRVGHLADVIVVKGNPLADLKVFYPPLEGAAAGTNAGVAWTVKDGIAYDAPRLLREVREMVSAARATSATSP